MGNTVAIGGAYADQDLTGSTLTNCIFVGGAAGNPTGASTLYVNSANIVSGDGSTWGKALGTIAQALNVATPNSVIYIQGSFTESVTINTQGVSIVGVGTGPKQAVWTSAVDTATCTIAAAYCSVRNIYFRPPVYSASTTYGPSAILLNGASWAYITGNRFQGRAGSYNAIYSPVCNSDDVHILGNEFYYMNTITYGAAILGVEAGGLSYSNWVIKNNTFSSCVIAINVNCRAACITDNSIAEGGITALGVVGTVLAMGMDLSGTSSGANIVWRNQLGGAYTSSLYVKGASGDQWAGNLNVITGGTTAANP